MKSLHLEWRSLVRFVRSGEVEKHRQRGIPTLMFWADQNKAVFVSDPFLLEQIDTARSHSNPFVLIGPQHTGKNVFLNLVARSSPVNTSLPCIDENVVGEEQEEVERFFGKGGVVDRNREALLHFDFMEQAVSWGRFVEKLHKLAVERVLDRTDGQALPCPGIRVVLGANEELPPRFPQRPELMKYLYGALAGNQLARTHTLAEQADRLPVILQEMLAALVVRGEIDEQMAERTEKIPKECFNRLKQYSVPNEFTGLFGLVRSAARDGWEKAVNDTRPGRVFVAWGGRSRNGGIRLAEKLRECGIVVEKAPEVLTAGKWWPQIEERLTDVDFVVFTFCRADFRPSTQLVKLKEWRKAVEHEKSLARNLIFIVFLDKTSVEDLKKIEGLDQELLASLVERQWHRVSWRSRKSTGFEKLYADLSDALRKVRGS